MAIDRELCRYYIGRDQAFWQRVENALDAALQNEKAAQLMEQISCQLLEKKNAKKGGELLTQFAQAAEDAGPLAPLGALAALLPKAIQPYKKQGADDQILKDTFGDVLRWVDRYRNENGQDGLSELCWAVKPYANQLYQIGCLQYEPMKSRLPVQVFAMNDQLMVFCCGGVYADRAGRACRMGGSGEAFITSWKQHGGEIKGHLIDPNSGRIMENLSVLAEEHLTRMLRPGDSVLSVHIPAGTSLEPADVDSSIQKAKQFFKAAGFPCSLLVCHSWLLDPQLKAFLPAESRILGFARRFVCFTMPGEGTGARYVFGTDKPVQQLPESAVRTHLQRAVREHLRWGGSLYDFGGVMLI